MEVNPGCSGSIVGLLAMLVFTMFFGIRTTFEPVPDLSPAEPLASDSVAGEAVKSTTIINDVEVITAEAYPMPLTLQVSGDHPDGCDYPVEVAQWREGDTVYVEIYRLLPADAICTQMLTPYEDSIKLDGVFESGTYKIEVNGFVIDITL